MTFSPYIGVVLTVVISTVIALIVVLIGIVLGPRKPSDRKLAPYESGVQPVGDAMHRLPVRFYLVATLFIIFDIEVIFLYPWALVYRQLALFWLIEMGIFLLILLVGYIYIWQKGALEWNQ